MVAALQLTALSKSFGNKPAVANLTLEIPQGMLYAFLGPNGAGKTTTLRMVAGLLKPDAGDALILGHSIQQSPQAAKQVLAYAPDAPLLYGKLTPLEYLEFVAGLWGVPAAKAQTLGRDLLKQLGLWDERKHLCETFSLGMRQKLALAGALIHDPQLMILDEPLSGLDVGAARLIKDMLQDYVSQGRTVILTTHVMEIAERMAERIGIISQGGLIAEGTLQQLQAQSGEQGGTLETVFLDLVQSQPPLP
jgi:ABC-2 type transport system ATP-binding protein